MRDLASALGLFLAVEGLCFAAFPAMMKRAMLEAAQGDEDLLRKVGLGSALLGVVIVFLVRGGF